jgi:hypothetical protein
MFRVAAWRLQVIKQPGSGPVTPNEGIRTGVAVDLEKGLVERSPSKEGESD